MAFGALHPRRLARRARIAGTIVGTRLLTPNTYDIRNTIVICGSARSGTTWAAQTIAAIPGSAVLFEPLNQRRVPLARQVGFGTRAYLRPGSSWPEGERAFEQILRGRVLNTWTAREIPRPLRVHTWIFKCIRANRLLPWLIERFPVRTPVLLLRHPCAVVASQTTSWGSTREGQDPAIVEDFPQARSILESLETDEEHRAARWAIDVLIPLSAANSDKMIVLPYERLVRDAGAFAPAFERWNVPMPSGLAERARLPSSTVLRSHPGDPVTSWTQRLSSDQVRRVLAVTQAFGLDFYGEDPEPDDSRLARWL